MKYDEFYWEHNDCLNKDTSLAHSFGEKVWIHQQKEIDRCKSVSEVLGELYAMEHDKNKELQKRVDDALIVIDNLSWASESDVIKIKEILKGEIE